MIYFPRDKSYPSINNDTQNSIFHFFKKKILQLVSKFTIYVSQNERKNSPTVLVTSANQTGYFPVFSASSHPIYDFLLVVLITQTHILKYQKTRFFLRGSPNFNNCLQIFFTPNEFISRFLFSLEFIYFSSEIQKVYNLVLWTVLFSNSIQQGMSLFLYALPGLLKPNTYVWESFQHFYVFERLRDSSVCTYEAGG